MPVKVRTFKIYNEFRNESVDWLLANVGDKIRIEAEIDVFTVAMPSTNNEWIAQNTDGYLGSNWLTSQRPDFKDFKIGDTLSWYSIPGGTYTNFTVVDKLSDFEIQLDAPASGGTDVTISGDVILSVTTAITAVRYKWNFIENDDAPTFASKIDGSIQELVAKSKAGSDTSITAMEFTGAKDYQIGSGTIQGQGISTTQYYKTSYKIVHYTYLTPFMLSAQWDDLQAGTAPDYFFDSNCLKGVFDFEAMYNFTDPNRIQTESITEISGNSGWFDENFNNIPSNYYIDSVTFKRPDNTVIPGIELVTTETTVTIVLKNTVDAPFSNNNTKFSLNIIKAPFSVSDYQGTGRTMDANFMFDRALQTVGSAAINGDQYGVTGRQILKDVSATYNSTSQITITAKIAMDQDGIDFIQQSEEYRYLLWVAVQKHSLATSSADKVALFVDVDEFYEDFSDPGLITIQHTFLRHPEEDPDTEGLASLTSAFIEDEVVGYSRFYLDLNGRSGDDISITSVVGKVKVKKASTGDEFTLDTFTFDMTGLPTPGGIQYVDFELNRPFKIPEAEPRRALKLKRRTDLDGGDLYYYEMWYPFLMRWEYWVQLLGVDNAFFDPALPNNGEFQLWHYFSTVTGWKIYFETEVKVKKNGHNLSFTEQTVINSRYYDSNSAWEPDTIKTYNNADNTLLTGGGKDYVLGYEDTRIEAEFTLASGTPVLARMHMLIGIEVYEEGGISGKSRLSSKWVTDGNTILKSSDGSGKVVLSLSGSTVKGVCLIDKSKIDSSKQRYSIMARLYELETPTGKNFQDGEDFNFQDGIAYDFQDQ